SDLRALYQAPVARGERMPVAFAVGSHPTDFLAAVAATAPMDELDVVGAVRGAPVPVVKCVTVDVRVPADAELVLEGYIDERGPGLVAEGLLRGGGAGRPEGPSRQFPGFSGPPKNQPVFPPHRHYQTARRAVPDRDHRRRAADLHRHGATRRRQDRGRDLERA